MVRIYVNHVWHSNIELEKSKLIRFRTFLISMECFVHVVGFFFYLFIESLMMPIGFYRYRFQSYFTTSHQYQQTEYSIPMATVNANNRSFRPNKSIKFTHCDNTEIEYVPIAIRRFIACVSIDN